MLERNKNRWRATLCGIGLLLLGSTGAAVAASTPIFVELAPDTIDTFTAQVMSAAEAEPIVLRSRSVAVSFEQLPDEVAADEAAPRFELNLFHDTSFVGIVKQIEGSGNGGLTYIGELESIAPSLMILVVDDGVMIGSVTTPTGNYQIRYAGNGVHMVREVDTRALPDELPPLAVTIDEGDDAIAVDEMAADSSAFTDVFTAYTAAARSAAGGTTAINNLIALGITETNMAYANSGVTQRVRNVGTAEVSYADPSGQTSNTNLSRLRNPSDGFMDNVHTLRDTYAADLVALIMNSMGGGCGIGYVMSTVSTSFESSAFSITQRNCVSPNYSYGHELGHNQGSHHDPANSGSRAYVYSQGYFRSVIGSANNFRTVMSYSTECTYGCTRDLYFSNPSVFRNGFTTGVANVQENARSLNNTDFTTANFRQSVEQADVIQLWPPPNPKGGTNTTLWARVKNGWGLTLPSDAQVWYWVSGDGAIDPDMMAGDEALAAPDVDPAGDSGYVGFTSAASQGVGSTVWYPFTYAIPGSASGSYSYWARVWSASSGGWIGSWEGPQGFTVAFGDGASEVTSLWPVTGAAGGQTSTLWARVANVGNADLPAGARVYWWLSGPGAIDPSMAGDAAPPSEMAMDEAADSGYIGSQSVGGQAPGVSIWKALSWAAPKSAAGTHYYWARVWDTGGAGWLSQWTGPQTFTVAASLFADVTSLWPVFGGAPGANVNLWARVQNVGGADLPANARVWYWVSGGYGYVGSTSVAGLTPGGHVWYLNVWSIPGGATPGAYQYWARVYDGATSTWLGAWTGPQDFNIN